MTSVLILLEYMYKRKDTTKKEKRERKLPHYLAPPKQNKGTNAKRETIAEKTKSDEVVREGREG